MKQIRLAVMAFALMLTAGATAQENPPEFNGQRPPMG